MNKLNFLGVGPKIGLIALPWLAATIVLSILFKETFLISGKYGNLVFYAGVGLLIAGLIFYFFTVPLLLKGLKETKLVVKGTFSLCCNPLYTAIILLIVPGVALMMNSWLVLTSSIAAYIAFKMYIKAEYAELEKFFGDEYIKYRERTPEFFPFIGK
jgi:protein-S-isoprenylcysteine O-methyltransferase Ste14